MAAASEEFVEEDVNRLQFGKDFGTAEFLSNTEVSLILETLKTQKYARTNQRPPEVFNKALEYATNHMGAVQISDPAAIDELFTALRQMSFDRASEDEDGPLLKLSLQNFQIVALANLNPSSVAAARSLIPSLELFADNEVEEMLVLLKRSSAKYTGIQQLG